MKQRLSDEGLQAQMNSVIGALQELKLLQVQTALKELEFSSNTSQINHRSLSTSSSFSSQEDTTDNFSSYDIDDSTDWTASLMNHSRNRQPLVLGDNVFADLVGNWLDLPDVGGQTAGKEQNDLILKDTFSESSSSSHSQDLSRKLSLTAGIFKRVLRRVRPLHHQESKTTDVCKQPKITCRKSKSDVSKPFWARTRGMKKNTPIQQEGSEGLIDRGWAEIVEKHPSVFDYSSAVWV
uniref:PAK4-inhibitor INKA2 n=1 Tax=Cyprinus carpio TaxID=7962 RepID=A0A8C2EVG4_CYPCA